jgi:hypothetical protein
MTVAPQFLSGGAGRHNDKMPRQFFLFYLALNKEW